MENDFNCKNKKIESDTTEDVSIDLLNDIVEFSTDVPVIGVVNKLLKLCNNIKDRLFIEKVIAFIYGTNGLDEIKRKKALKDIEEKMKSRSGEQLLYMIDRMNNKQKIDYLSKLFVARVNDVIDTECFFRLFIILERIPYLDVEKLKQYRSDYYDIYTVDLFHSMGVIRLSKINNGYENMNSDKYILSYLGIKLIEILFDEKPENNMEYNKSIQISGMLKSEFIGTTDEVKI